MISSGNLEGDPHGETQLHHETEVLREGDEVLEPLALEAEEDRERLGQQHQETEGRARR